MPTKQFAHSDTIGWKISGTVNDPGSGHYSFDERQLVSIIFWQTCCGKSRLSNGSFIYHLT